MLGARSGSGRGEIGKDWKWRVREGYADEGHVRERKKGETKAEDRNGKRRPELEDNKETIPQTMRKRERRQGEGRKPVIERAALAGKERENRGT